MSHRFMHRIMSTNASFSPLILRIPIGIIFAAHGAQKLFGLFGGHGLEGTGIFFSALGLTPGYLMALMAGSAEFFGGLGLIFGLLVRPAAAALAFTMLTAILVVHISHGLFLADNGVEYALALMAAASALLISGAGRLSLDALLTKQKT